MTVDAAEVADHAIAGHGCGDRRQIEREEMAVGTGGSAARAAVELAIAVAGDGLDVADRGPDLGRDEFEHLGDVAPFGDRTHLETRHGTVTPQAGGCGPDPRGEKTKERR